jgi:hypothetical protein
MSRVAANHEKLAVTPHEFAILADTFYAGSNFHGPSPVDSKRKWWKLPL